MKIPRIMIAATGSGSGKTMITCALLQTLKEIGKKAAAFKCGPDYIDPMFHKKILGIPSKNLDTFFTDHDLTKALFLEDAEGKDISVMEGVMGLYDGLLGIYEEASSYELAKMTKTPIILVLDAHGMGRSIIPLIAGFLQFDREHLIKGVILNRINPMFYKKIKPEIESYLPIKVIGGLPHKEEFTIESRHLGLTLPEEMNKLHYKIKAAAESVKAFVDLSLLIKIAEAAQELTCSIRLEEKAEVVEKQKVRLGIAMDEAFCFYYEDNLRLLQRMGAKLIPFSPIHDQKLPDGISGIILGGGYPELYAGHLSENASMKKAVAAAIEKDMPSIAECGGFLYLHDEIKDMEGKAFKMAGVIHGKCQYSGKLVRFGYIQIQEKQAIFLEKGQDIKGHEFHYYDSTKNGQACVAQKPRSDRSWECVHASVNAWWGFPHLYYYSNPQYAAHFIERAAEYEK